MILVDYRAKNEIYMFCYDKKDLPDLIEWLKKQYEKMEKRGKTINSIWYFQGKEL